MRYASAAIMALALGLWLSGPSGAVAEPPAARLDSRLQTIADAFEAGGMSAAGGEAERLDVGAEGDRVRVIVETDSAGAANSVAGSSLGAFERRHGDLVQLSVPVASLRAISGLPGVRFVRPPMRAVPLVEGEGVGAIDADDWHAAGVTGAGVKLAVLDPGFAGYEALLGTELPASVTTQSFRTDGDITGGGIDHGTHVAEIAHEVAPGASLYLVNFDTEVELAAATDWLAIEGVAVINASWGYFTSGPGDGTGIVDDIITDSVDDGAFWAVAAGNHAARHWSATFTDTDGDLFHEFQASPADEGNQVFGVFFGLLVPGETVIAEIRWNDPYGAACRDYDLYLLDSDGGPPIVVAASTNVQNDGTDCVAGADPVESLSHVATEYDTYHLAIKKSVASTDAMIDLYTSGQDLEYAVAAGSLLQPGDHPDVATAGAFSWDTPTTVEAFSSRGPNSAGVIKPDIVAPDGVSTSGGQFYGTSAAAPHLAGAAALVSEFLPCLSASELRDFIESAAVDLGAAGKDNESGSGRLALGAPPPDTDGDGVGDACEGDIDGDGCADAEETGINPLQGGMRDPASVWDFYDVPAPAGPTTGADGKLILTPSSGRNKAVTLQDVGVVLAYVGRAAANAAYAADNNADGQPDGMQLDRTPSVIPTELWHSGPPNDAISLQDVGVALAQVGHSCTSPP